MRHRYKAAQVLAEILNDELNDDDSVDDELDASSESEADVVEEADVVADEFGVDGDAGSSAAVVSEVTVPEQSDTTLTDNVDDNSQIDICADDNDLPSDEGDRDDDDSGGDNDDSGAESDNGEHVMWSRCGSVAWRKTAPTTSRQPTRNILTGEPGLPSSMTFQLYRRFLQSVC